MRPVFDRENGTLTAANSTPLTDGASTVLHVPHASTAIPAGVRERIVLDDEQLAAELAAMTDWHTVTLALAAAKAAGVLYNVDEFATQFFKRGAVKVTLFEAEGMGKENRDEFLSWWKRLTGGISKSFNTVSNFCGKNKFFSSL